MRYRSIFVLPILALTWFPERAVAQTTTVTSYLQVTPYEGHPGDPLFVMGAGFKPGAQEQVTMACPDALSAGPNYVSVIGPKTDSHGRFVRFKMHSVAPTGLTTPMSCTIYASVGTSYFGPDIRPHYLVLPPHQRLDPCAMHICGVKVKARPLHARYGLLEQIAIHDPGWPGAFVSVGLRYGKYHQEFRRVSLDYQGSASLRWLIHVHVASPQKAMKVAVTARLRLGSNAGSGVSSFFVVH